MIKTTDNNVVTIKNISKSFGDSQVLFNIGLSFHEGEIHAIVGENGAGKSTVGKIIGGYYSRDSGKIIINGKTIASWDPRSALSAGIAMIHQELSLVPHLTVSQNVFLGNEASRFGILSGNDLKRYQELDELCGFGLNPDEKVYDLRIADQQKVEIMRALSRNARVIIMDEPTSSLTADETERLHQVMKKLKDKKYTIIYVTHFLEHVLAYADRVSVMRDGQLIKTAFTGKETKSSLVESMLGYAAEIAFPDCAPAVIDIDSPVLEVRQISTDNGVENVSFKIHQGEIVGLLGLVGSGRTETARAVFGADNLKDGKIIYKGKQYDQPTPRKSIRQGLAMIPEDRRKQGLVVSQSLRTNVTLPHLSGLDRWGVINQNKEKNAVRKLIDRLGIVPARIDGDVFHFSGGNQQKVLFAKWMFKPPDLVILDEPTRGVDVGAKCKIYELISQLAGKGTAVLLISSELEEVLGLAHRGYLMCNGSTFSEIDTSCETVENVLHQLFEAGDQIHKEYKV